MLASIQSIFSDIKNNPFYWVAMLLGMAGAHLTSGPVLDTFGRGLGFFVWIFSNGYLLYRFKKDGNIPMTGLFILYEYYNIRGVLNSW